MVYQKCTLVYPVATHMEQPMMPGCKTRWHDMGHAVDHHFIHKRMPLVNYKWRYTSVTHMTYISHLMQSNSGADLAEVP